MQVKKKHRDTERSAGDIPDRDGLRAKSSCFSNIKIFLISECALMLAQGTVGAYLVSVLTTLERRFNLQSADVGVIASSFEIGNLALILFVSYFGAKAHRPRLIGCGGIVMALGALLSALPEFLTNQYEIGERTDLGRDVCYNGSNAAALEAEDKLCANKANTNMMYLLLIGAQVLLGIGATPVQPLGVSYIDDHVKKKDSSLYIGILFSTLVFGPACGFILGSLCTKFYVDAIFIGTSQLGITPDDPRWIGAWWAGFLLCGALLFFSALLMFGFPQSLPTRDREDETESEQVMLPPSLSADCETPKPSNGAMCNYEPATSATCCQQLRVIPKVTKHLLSNPVFTCIILAACMEIAVVAGFAAFLAKYLEQQFNLTTTSANQLLGMTAIPCACLGIFMGGLLVKKLNLSALGAIRMAMLVNLISTACYISFLFLGCNTGPVAGVTVAYGNETEVEQKPEAQCISHCYCVTSSISPVCGSNGVTYLSACFAGCTRSLSPRTSSTISQNLTGCTCISPESELATALPGKCPTEGCREVFLIFLCVICICSLVGAMAQTPSVIILIRTVSPELKSYALGVLFLLLRLLGFIPPPLIFGAGIDSTCLFWSSDCGDRGACLLYDNITYRHLYVSLAIVLKGIAFLLYTTTWYCLRRNYKKYIKGNEDHLSPTEFYPSLTDGPNLVDRKKFIYNLEDHEFCENMESVL
ncbi:solute carrier organic anion transporter family member 3A1 isoform X1 [Thalassophryne amazonica]|uniref:solute carrier organic anion transporter family member 3A1 isoform X1 n=1 Tax=Thalassophryne amazonica TaxID=390379 RepID=UPI001470A622|nr:solute carrier organic anion transporter family member 3A1 isoform X1 [Thalassophryne amazonica]